MGAVAAFAMFHRIQPRAVQSLQALVEKRFREVTGCRPDRKTPILGPSTSVETQTDEIEVEVEAPAVEGEEGAPADPAPPGQGSPPTQGEEVRGLQATA